MGTGICKIKKESLYSSKKNKRRLKKNIKKVKKEYKANIFLVVVLLYTFHLGGQGYNCKIMTDSYCGQSSVK